MPVYPGKKPNQWRVTLFHHGKQQEWTVPGTKAQAEDFLAEQRLTVGNAPDPRTGPTLREFCALVYKPHAQKHLKASTWNLVRVYQVATLCDHMGHLRLSELALAHIEQFKAARDVGPTSINNELRVLSAILNYAKELGYKLDRPTWKKVPVRGKPKVRCWTVGQVQSLYQAAGKVSPELLAMLVFLINTGCRKGEAMAAEWSWVDFERGLLWIPSTDTWQPKNGKPREVPLSTSLRAMLQTRFDDPNRHPRLIFPNMHGGQYVCFPKDLLVATLAAAKLTGSPHWTRHTFASLFLARKPDLYLLAQVMGHSHVRVTELYTHLLPGHLEGARNAVDLAPELGAPAPGSDASGQPGAPGAGQPSPQAVDTLPHPNRETGNGQHDGKSVAPTVEHSGRTLDGRAKNEVDSSSYSLRH